MISDGEGQANFILSRVKDAMVVETLSVFVVQHEVAGG